MRLRTTLLVALLTAAAGQQPVLKSGIRTIVVDVVVTHPRTGPVAGLTQGDFEIRENGRPQQITTFAEVRLDRQFAPGPETALAASAAVPVPDGRLVLIVVDDAMMPPNAYIVGAARDIARGIVAGLRTRDRAAVTFTQTSSAGVEPTDRREVLLAAVDRIRPGMGGGFLAERAAVDTIRRVGEALNLSGERRCIIAFIGIGVPIDIKDIAMPTATLSGDRQGRAGELYQLVRDALDFAHRGNTPIYTFDPAGLAGLQPLIQARNPRMRVSDAYERARPYLDFNEVLAANTGGRSAVNTNAFGPAIDRMFEDTSVYYLLGFQSTDPRQQGRFRHLQVRVKRPGVDVRARQGYWEERPPPR